MSIVLFCFLFLLTATVVSSVFVTGQIQSHCTVNGIDLSFLETIPDQFASSVGGECGGLFSYSYAVALCRSVTKETSQACNATDANFCNLQCNTGPTCPLPENHPISEMKFTSIQPMGSQTDGLIFTGNNTESGNDKQGNILAYCPSAAGAPAPGHALTYAGVYPAGSYKCNAHVFIFSHPLICGLASKISYSDSDSEESDSPN